MGDLKCLTCVGDHKSFMLRREAGLTPEDAAEPVIRDAVTLAPQWSTAASGPGQVIMGVVAVPACYEHLAAKPLTPEELAVRGGRLLTGHLGPN